MKPTKFCEAVVKMFEGYRPLYKDAAGFWTSGYGHKWEAGETPRPLDLVQADVQLTIDLDSHAAKIEAILAPPAEFCAHEFDAMTLLAFNIGVEAFKNSQLLKHIVAGELDLAKASWLQWDHVNGVINQGLANRRTVECALFFETEYSI